MTNEQRDQEIRRTVSRYMEQLDTWIAESARKFQTDCLLDGVDADSIDGLLDINAPALTASRLDYESRLTKFLTEIARGVA